MDVEKAKELLTKCKEETGATEGELDQTFIPNAFHLCMHQIINNFCMRSMFVMRFQ